MYKIIPISRNSHPAALERAQRYRLLNEPADAESICLDILDSDPENQEALAILLLALPDQFADRREAAEKEARKLIPQFKDEYSRIYYSGIISERFGKSHLREGKPGSGHTAYDWLTSAIEKYEKAAEIREPGNDESILRRNTCVRILRRNPQAGLRPRGVVQDMLE